MIVLVQSTKTLNNVDVSWNAINLSDFKCLCRAFHVSVMESLILMCTDNHYNVWNAFNFTSIALIIRVNETQ